MWLIGGVFATAFIAGVVRFMSIWVIGGKAALNPDGGMGLFFHIALPILVSIGVCSFLRTKNITTKVIRESTQTSGSPVSFMANTSDAPIFPNTDRHIAIGIPTSSPDRDNASFAGQLEVSVDEENIYVAIATELETGSVDKGLWTRLFAECSGDEQQTKALYIKQRAERLISAERISAEKNEADRIAAEKTGADKRKNAARLIENQKKYLKRS